MYTKTTLMVPYGELPLVHEVKGASVRSFIRCAFVVASYGVPLVVLISCAFLFVHPEKFWAWNRMALPPVIVIIFLSAYLVSWHTFDYKTHRKYLHLQAAFILLGLYLLVEGPTTLGDTWARTIGAENAVIGKSSMLSIATYIAFANMGIAQSYISPLAGFASAVVAFKIIDALSADDAGLPHPPKAILGHTLYLGTVIHLLFFSSYQEMTQVSVPFLLIALLFAVRYLRGFGLSDVNATFFTAFLVLAGLFHGANTFLLPLIPLVFAWHLLLQGKNRAFFRELRKSIKLLLLLSLVSMGILALFGFTLSPGDMYGGGDGKFFVSFGGPLEGFERYHAFSPGHFYEIGNILVSAAPAAVLLSVAFPFVFVRRRILAFLSEGTTVFLALGSLGYYSLIFLHNLDLGYPTDLDLMLAMSTPLLMLAIYAVMRLLPTRMGYAIAAVSITFAWGFSSTFLTAPILSL